MLEAPERSSAMEGWDNHALQNRYGVWIVNRRICWLSCQDVSNVDYEA